ncbi:NAD(P)/FAD-dependent oxidoreductase [Inquilinus sp. Marseille-Q2685]|uniref:FAD-dependent oxidoreductase n=1 Tax=Inquilinus sp. Marseille-Q2685 TaxID=2866581 RepID=UPI001CE3BBD0|nr:NAD(P)/FAD-dependent oxidoreductase [Inquilinus sp. Marseille-Q2685]
MTEPLSIAVCGCGPAGLAAACFLHDAGHQVRLLERFAEPRPIGAGLMLQPAGLAALGRIGALDAALAYGQRIDGLYARSEPSGRVVFDLSYAAVDPALHGLAIHRAAIFEVLWQAAASRRIPVETGVEIAALAADAEGRPVPVAAAAAGRRLPAVDLVVDATGSGSALRPLAHAPVQPKPYAYGAVWATVPAAGLRPDRLEQRFRAAREMLGLLPVGRMPGDDVPRAILFWSLKVAEHPALLSAGIAAWRRRVLDLWPEIEPVIAGITDTAQLTLARYAQATLRRPFGDRIAFIGDAAHSTSPQLGAGVTMAMLDGAALADALAAEPDIPRALAAYGERRRRHIRFYQRMSALLTPAFQSDSRWIGALRDRTFHPSTRLPWLRRRMVETFAGLALGPFAKTHPATLAGMPSTASGTASEELRILR